ncbi:DUF4956 domain-containing protein [Dactylosporangium sp. NPDC049742]|uniref:DUF4956 domain-containing protein n=1 Tax=Dactylosporangium sp. NPDC049742 TaxID=3154737 RepID=UPI00343F3F85
MPIATVYLERNASSHFRPLVDSARVYAPLLRFAASSMLAGVVDAAVLFALHAATGALLPSVLAARAVSSTTNFAVNRRLVFGGGRSSLQVAARLGLFGVLSIIRLRSNEIAQHEIAYYFAALALGLLAGLSPAVGWLTAGLMALVIGGLFVADHPRLFGRYRQQTMQLDRAHTDETALRAHLEGRLGGRVVNLTVRHVDLVNDTTLVEVRYVVGATSPVRTAERVTV